MEVRNVWEKKQTLGSKAISQLQSPTDRINLMQTKIVTKDEDFPSPIILKKISFDDENKNISEDFVNISEQKISLITKIDWDQQKENSIKKDMDD